MSDAGIYWEQQFRAKAEELVFANQAWRDTYQQLAAERALCDRLAERVKQLCGWSPWSTDVDLILADYTAHRATERANTEKGAPTDD